MTPRRAICVLLAVFTSQLAMNACGSSAASPSAPTTTTTTTNASPILASMTVSPSFGVSGLSTFTASASASDANGDPLTYTWAFGSATLTGASVSGVVSGDGAVTVRVTVSDGKGGSATDSRTVTIGTLTGTWDVVVTYCANDPFNMTLTQSGGNATGTFAFPRPWCAVPSGSTAITDPAEPGTINASGAVRIRYKVGAFTDAALQGTMSTSGRSITGGVFNSGFIGQNFTATKR